MSWFRFVYTSTKQFQNQKGRIQNFPSAASLAEILFFETEQSWINLAPFTFPKLNSWPNGFPIRLLWVWANMLFALNSVWIWGLWDNSIHQPYPDEELFVTGTHVTSLNQGPSGGWTWPEVQYGRANGPITSQYFLFFENLHALW